MKKHTIFSLIFLLFAGLGYAQGLVNITGVVTKVNTSEPVANHQVFCYTSDSLSQFFVEVLTNQNGEYSAEVTLSPGFTTVQVATITFCDPANFFTERTLNVANGETVANFEICNDSFPPFNDCFADFYFTAVDSLTFEFNGFYYSPDSTLAATYLWDFGDGTTSTDQNPVHTFPQDGFYVVTLTVTGADGCTSTIQYPFETSFNGFPDCMGYILYTQIDSTTFEFSAELYDANGSPIQADTYSWDFGDGNTSTDANPTHTYAQPDIYTVQLHALTEDGCEVHACEVVFAINCPIDTFWYGCQAMFATGITWDSLGGIDPNGNPLGGDPLTVSFIDLSLGGVITWTWHFGDSTTSAEQNPVHTYAQEGNYIVTLAITTLDGCESEISFEICVGNNCWLPEPDCQAMFIPLPDSLGGNGIQFLDLSYTLTPVQSWSWDFGDGTTSTEQNPFHEYSQPGTYVVSLTIVADSCNSVISFELDTENPWNFSNDGNVAQLGVSGGSVAVKEPKRVFEAAKLFPNPAQQEISVAFNSPKDCAYELRVTDISGKTLLNSQQTATIGLNAARLNISNLTSGMYFAEIRSADSVQTIKFVKE